MYELLIALIVLGISLYMLVKSSDYLISTSSILGSRMGISKVVIGLTLVAIGTSLPELMSVIFGLVSSNSGGDFFSGTIIGSNIANSLLILATLLYFTQQKLSSINPRENWFLVLSTLFFIIMLVFNQISIFAGIIFLAFFATYLYMTIFSTKSSDLEDETDEFDDENLNKKSSSMLIGIFIASLVGLNLAARGVVYGIDNVAVILAIPQFILTFTTVALATSLPELVVTIRAAKDKQTDIALGNIIGSNISNILFIGGVGSIIIESMKTQVITSLLSIGFLATATLVLLFISKYLSKKHYKTGAILIFITYLSIIGTTIFFG